MTTVNRSLSALELAGAALIGRMAVAWSWLVVVRACGVSLLARLGKSRSLDAKKAPGLVISFGHDHPRARISRLSASVTARADQTAGSIPADEIASQIAPICP